MTGMGTSWSKGPQPIPERSHYLPCRASMHEQWDGPAGFWSGSVSESSASTPQPRPPPSNNFGPQFSHLESGRNGPEGELLNLDDSRLR